jgi:antitoxin component YwqK of YwqJK toxin-antitoxin module
LNFKGYAHNGLRTGEYFQFYDNGQIELRTQFINDKPDGLFQGFFPNGNRKIVCYYKNGKKDGVWQSYDSTGKYLSKEIYQNDVRLN